MGQPQVRVGQQGPQAAAPGTAGQSGTTAQQGAAVQQGAQSGNGVPLQRVSELISKNVKGANGRDAGEVQNLLIDRSGNVRAAVVEWGGFLGLGERLAVVPIEQLQLGTTSEEAQLNMTRQDLERLGGFDQNNLTQYSSRYGWGDIRLYR